MITVYYRKVFPFKEENTFVESLLKKTDKKRREKLRREGYGSQNDSQYDFEHLPAYHKKMQAMQLSAGSLLHDVLCDWLGLSPESAPPFDFMYEEGGKPYLPGRGDVHFNLSHSGDYVCVAISDKPVGVDIQNKETGKQKAAAKSCGCGNDREKKIAERFFTPADRELLSACKEAQYKDLFYRMWSIKESYVKLTGEGMSRGLSGFEIEWQKQKILTEENGKREAFFWEWKEIENYSLCVCSHFLQQEVWWKEMPDILR